MPSDLRDRAANDFASRQNMRLASGVFLGTGGLLSLGVLRGGSSKELAALVAAIAGLAVLGGCVFRRHGPFSMGGITWVMVATLFVGRWFFPPVTSDLLITERARAHYDRPAALVAAGVMIVCFTLGYLVVHRRFLPDTPGPRVVRAAQSVTGVPDLVVVSFALVLARLFVGHYLHIGVPGRPPATVPLVGVIYFATSLGPLAGAALIICFGRARRASRLAAGSVLLSLVLVESSLGSHGTAFQACIVYGAALNAVGSSSKLTIGKAAPLAVVMAGVITSALLIAFVARTSLNGGSRRSLAEVPAFVVNRLGGIEYAAPAIGAVDSTGSQIAHLRAGSWSRYVTTEVYGLPADAYTAFATTAVGWWYGVGHLTGVALGGALSGVLSGMLDRWRYRRRGRMAWATTLWFVGIWLAWATFLLGGTIGSLGGITVGFSFMVFALARFHNLLAGTGSARSHQGVSDDKQERPPKSSQPPSLPDSAIERPTGRPL